MEVTVRLPGDGTTQLELTDPTYGDILAALDLSIHEAAVLVDGRPVPETALVDTDEVTVLRLVHGG